MIFKKNNKVINYKYSKVFFIFGMDSNLFYVKDNQKDIHDY